MHPHEKIRNFSIIAHIDHGKSTLADRILERTGALSKREMHAQVLDDMDLERERGITIKARAVRLDYLAPDGQAYVFNLIDTPGHVDFSYEVSRSLAACEGALLVVDAAQGVEAQTLANAYLAVNGGLELLPVINKIDLPAADPDRAKEQIEQVIGIDASTRCWPRPSRESASTSCSSASSATSRRPRATRRRRSRRCSFDSWYDVYRGVACLVRVIDGTLRRGDKIQFVATGRIYTVEELGTYHPKPRQVEALGVGEVGYIYANIKDLTQAKIGDTVTHPDRPTLDPYPGFQEVKPMVFAGLFPVVSEDYEDLRDAVDKLRLNDASFSFEPESSAALGFGFRCGFLGLLHMEIIQERLEREFNLVAHHHRARRALPRQHHRRPADRDLESRRSCPTCSRVDSIEEPYITLDDRHPRRVRRRASSRWPRTGAAMQKSLQYLSSDRVLIEYDFPLAEVIHDFYDKLKSVSRGYASFDYEFSRLPRRATWSSSTSWSTASRSTRCRSWSTARRLRQGQGAGREDEGAHPAPALRGHPPGRHRQPRSSPARRSRRCARTCSPSATAATSRASASCSRSRRKARSG